MRSTCGGLSSVPSLFGVSTSVSSVSTSVTSVDEKLLWGAWSMARSIILGGRGRGDLAKKRAVDAECIKAATTANAREAPEVSSGNRRGPLNQLKSHPKKNWNLVQNFMSSSSPSRVPVLLGAGSGEGRGRPPRLASFLHPWRTWH